MGLNFLGVGFNFGAQDTGLEAALTGISQQFQQLNENLKGVKTSATEGLAPAASFVEDLQGQMAGLQQEAGLDLEGALEINGAGDDTKDQLGGVEDALEGVKEQSSAGATDFGRMANSVLGGAGKMTAAMGWVGMAIGPVIGGFGQAAESAGGLVDAVAGIPGRIGGTINRIANDGINLTNSLEGEAVALGQTARQVGVNMGYTGDRLREFIQQSTGMAMGLNIGADEAARAIRAWDEAADDLGAVGLRSAADVARLTAGLGINADVLRNNMMELRNLGAEDEQIHLITSALAQMGRETGDVSAAMQQLPQMVQMLERRRALGDTPEQMAAFATDTVAAARGLFEFTQDSDRARDMASQLAGTMTESREAFQNMFAGTEDQLPQLVTELAITRGEVDESFQLMQAGPGGLIEGMGQLVQRTRENNGDVGRLMEFMRGRLQQVFGADMTATLVNFWRTMDDETVAAMGAVREASVDLGEMGREAHTTGRTMDEVFERMRAGFQTAMRAIARRDSRDFLRRTQESLGNLRVSMQEAARSGGPLSDVMGTLSRTQQLGALALLPAELRGSAVAADELRGQVMPLIQAFTSWGGVLNTVLGYVGIFAADVIATWGRLKRQARRAGEALDPMTALGRAIDQQADRYAGILINMIGNIENFVTRAVDAFADFNFDNLFATTPEGEEETGVMGAIRRVLDRLGDVDWGRIWKQLQKGFNNLFERVQPWLTQKVDQVKTIIVDRISKWWSNIDWDAVGTAMGDMAGTLWGAFEPALSRLGEYITNWFSENWGDILTGAALAFVAGVTALIVLAVAALVAGVVGLAALVAGIVAAPFIAIYYELREYGGEIAQFFLATWNDLVRALGGYKDDIVEIWNYVAAGFEDTWRSIKRWFEGLWNGIVAWFGRIWDRITTTVSEVVETWRGIFAGIEEFFGGMGESIRATFGAVIDWISERWQAYVDNLTAAWDTISETIGGFWDSITETASGLWDGITSVPETIRTAWAGVSEFFSGVFTRISEALQPVMGVFQRIQDVGTGAFQGVMDRVVGLFGHSVNDVVGGDMAATEEVMTTAANNISATIEETIYGATVDAIVGGFATGFTQVVEGMEEFSQEMIDAFTLMGESISGVLSELFQDVLAQAEIAMIAAETAVEGVIGRLRSITEAQARLAEERGESIASLARPADEEALRRRMAQLQGNEVLQAIHHPDWYGGIGGRGGYQQLFVAKMNELRAALEAADVGGGGGTVENRRRLIREAAERLPQSRVGGQPGLPARGR